MFENKKLDIHVSYNICKTKGMIQMTMWKLLKVQWSFDIMQFEYEGNIQC
jgi:hypothetical protein